MILSMGGGGAERQLAYLAPALSERGHDVHLAYVFCGPNAERLDQSRCTLHHLGAAQKWRVLLPAQLLSLLRRLRPDVSHTWLAHMDIVGGTAARILRVPWVMSERSAALSYPPSLLNRMRVAVGKHADLIVPNSEGGAAYWAASGADPKRIEVVPNFVPIADIDAAQPVVDARLGDDDELIVHIGRLSVEKNLSFLVDALQEVFRTCPRARFVFCGDGVMRAELTAQVERLRLTDRVLFAGFVPDVASWLKRARISVAVSRCEGHPNAVLESIAAGVPVVVSDIAAYHSLLGEEEATFVRGDDPQAIAAGLIRVLGDRVAAQQRAARARAALAAHSIETIAARYETVYHRAIEWR
jgi:glycosyltransferase involved in cell wall biosynthesis